MNEEESYEKLQDLLDLAQEVCKAGFYSAEDILDEIRSRLEK